MWCKCSKCALKKQKEAEEHMKRMMKVAKQSRGAGVQIMLVQQHSEA